MSTAFASTIAVPSATTLLRRDASAHSCVQHERRCSVTVYRVRISGKPFYVVSSFDEQTKHAYGILIFKPGKVRHVAAFRNISLIVSTNTGAVGESANPKSPFVRIFAIRYDKISDTISAIPTGTKPNCEFRPVASDGIAISACNRVARRVLTDVYNLNTQHPVTKLFRANTLYRYEDNDPAFLARMNVTSQTKHLVGDSISFTSERPQARLKNARIDVFYTDGLVRKTSFSMALLSKLSEIPPDDLLNGPLLFPISLDARLLVRGKAQPRSINPNAATIFLYRSGQGEFVVTEQIEKTISDTAGTKYYVIQASVEMTRRTR